MWSSLGGRENPGTRPGSAGLHSLSQERPGSGSGTGEGWNWGGSEGLARHQERLARVLPAGAPGRLWGSKTQTLGERPGRRVWVFGSPPGSIYGSAALCSWCGQESSPKPLAALFGSLSGPFGGFFFNSLSLNPEGSSHSGASGRGCVPGSKPWPPRVPCATSHGWHHRGSQ